MSDAGRKNVIFYVIHVTDTSKFQMWNDFSKKKLQNKNKI